MTRRRYELRAGIARLLRPEDGGRGPAVCACGTAGRNAEGEVAAVSVHLADSGRASVSGVHVCDSLWLCPVCAVRRSMEVQERAAAAAAACIAAGGTVWFGTLTVRHGLADRLADLRQAVVEGWRKCQAGAGWVGIKKRSGLLGTVRTIECPWGPVNGWHLHLHMLVLFEGRDEAAQRDACAAIRARWQAEQAGRGYEAMDHAQDFRPCYDAEQAAQYAAKGATELASGWAKESRAGLVHPFVLASRAQAGNDAAAALFREYAEAMPGTQQGTVSAALARKLGLESADDAEVPAEDAAEGKPDNPVVGAVLADRWKGLWGRGLVGAFLAVVEGAMAPDGGGWDGTVAPWLDAVARVPHPGAWSPGRCAEWRQADAAGRRALEHAIMAEERRGVARLVA